MVCDWAGSKGVIGLYDFDVPIVVIDGGRVPLAPFSTTPDEHSGEYQQDAQDKTSDDPSSCSSDQPTKEKPRIRHC